MGNPGTYEFGRFRLEIHERRLLKDGRSVAIAPKVFETLVVLVERRGRLVEKPELMALLWPDTLVEEINLARNISDLRKILNDGDGASGHIETVSKKGYRWTAAVQVPELQKNSTRETRGRLPWTLAAAAVAALTVAVMITAVRKWEPKDPSRAAEANRRGGAADSGTPGLLGTEVTQNYILSTFRAGASSTIQTSDSFKVVDPGVELTCPGPFHVCRAALSPTQSVDFKDLSILYESQATVKFEATAPPGYNGFDWENLKPHGGGIRAVSLRTNIPGLDSSRITFTASSIRVNMQGLGCEDGSFFELGLELEGSSR
jgi:DNA-binding winged helix-turn-helix (wHTH) protein